ncbi:HNH endonuclease family protein [Corynebacterium pyruviciproducens]|uniref:HNH endonuclease family protein n=1 Tax=Corynebacterium pyruviciproducens TaxID=598660 RepID=UPI0023F11A9B|nr:HNH endonuclease family protein [Corynebacterium pyruviciproducens]
MIAFRRLLVALTLILTVVATAPTAVLHAPHLNLQIVHRTPALQRLSAAQTPPAVGASLRHVPVGPPRRHVLGYERAEFGEGWGPLGTCTVRDYLEAASIPGAQLSSTTCDITGGHGVDPYSGDSITSTSALELDHVIPLSAAWDLGAYLWPEDKRLAFANDPLNLVIVTRAQNQAKSDQLPSQWLPPHSWSRCWYARRVALVAREYQLPLSQQERRVLRRQCIIRDFLP